jgi:hypothetical protein
MRTSWILKYPVALLILALAGQPARADDWRVYVNDRFGTRVEYPADVLIPIETSDDGDGKEVGDGQRFLSPDKKIRATVYAGFNVDHISVDRLYAAAIYDVRKARITYRSRGPTWFVLSGFKKSNAYYYKVMFSKDYRTVHTLEITYPATEKPTYDPLTLRMADSLATSPNPVQ